MPCLSPGDLPDPGIEPGSPALQADSLPSEPQGFAGRGGACNGSDLQEVKGHSRSGTASISSEVHVYLLHPSLGTSVTHLCAKLFDQLSHNQRGEEPRHLWLQRRPWKSGWLRVTFSCSFHLCA